MRIYLGTSLKVLTVVFYFEVFLPWKLQTIILVMPIYADSYPYLTIPTY